MPRTAVDHNRRLALRIEPQDKATLLRAVEIMNTDMTDFILRTALREAEAVIENSERIKLSARDSRRVLELLENPPPPNAKLRRAARDLPVRR